jgi:hypothetical protein
MQILPEQSFYSLLQNQMLFPSCLLSFVLCAENEPSREYLGRIRAAIILECTYFLRTVRSSQKMSVEIPSIAIVGRP